MSKIIQAFEKEVNLTEQGLAELTEKKLGLLIDVNTKSGMTMARKERTERNKLIEQVKRVAIDTKSSIDSKRNEITDKITVIFAPIVDAFEAEDLRLKQEAERIAKEEQGRIDEIKSQIAGIRNFSLSLFGKSSEELSEIIEAVDMIDVADSFSEFTQEAMLVKKETLGELNLALSGAIQSEQLAADRKALDDEKAEFEVWKKSQQKEIVVDIPVETNKENKNEPVKIHGGYVTKVTLTPYEEMINNVEFWSTQYGINGTARTDLMNILSQYK
tara:strand:- start:47 stop:865 length:819 start_codon:yes stop_codon:yes gene_type:complete